MTQQIIENNPKVKGNPSILLGTMEITNEEATTLGISSKRNIQIFGARIPSGKIYDGMELWSANFLIIETDKDQQYSSILAQITNGKGCFYCTTNGDNILSSSICGDMFNIKKIRCLRHPPKWKHYDAEIPMIENQTAFFLGQFYIKKGKLEKEYFIYEETIYLFAISTEDHLEFYIFTQDMNEQTAEDHYRLEEQMMTFEQHYKDLKIVQKLIKAGDKYLHQYIAENKRSNSAILTMLLASAKTKKLQKEIQARLDKINRDTD